MAHFQMSLNLAISNWRADSTHMDLHSNAQQCTSLRYVLFPDEADMLVRVLRFRLTCVDYRTWELF